MLNVISVGSISIIIVFDRFLLYMYFDFIIQFCSCIAIVNALAEYHLQPHASYCTVLMHSDYFFYASRPLIRQKACVGFGAERLVCTVFILTQ